MKTKILIGVLLVAFAVPMVPVSAYEIIDCSRMVPSTGCTTGTNPTGWTVQFGATAPVCDPSQNAGPGCSTGLGICTALQGLTTGTVDPAVNGAVGTVVGSLPPVHPVVDSTIVAIQGTVANLGPSAAIYHLLCDPNNAFLGFNQGDSLAGLVLCEDNGVATDPSDGINGAGGLCSMSPAFYDPVQTPVNTAECQFLPDSVDSRHGNSNGNAPDYTSTATTTVDQVCIAMNPAPANGLPVITTPARKWYKVSMQGSWDGTDDTPFGLQINSVSCRTGAGGTLVNALAYVYDDQYAYTVSNGDVAGFPTTAPNPANNPAVGGYTIDAFGVGNDPLSFDGPDAGTAPDYAACNGPQPAYFLL